MERSLADRASTISRRRAGRRVVAVAVYLVALFIAGMLAGSSAPPIDTKAGHPALTSGPSLTTRGGSPAPGPRRSAPPPPIHQRPPGEGHTTTTASDSDQDHRALQAIYDHLERTKAEADPGASAEAIANQSVVFLTGWVDGLRYASSRTLDRLGDDLRARLCSGGLGPEATIMTAYVLQWLPEVASPGAFECFFAAHHDEDVALWTMLDAWRNSGLDATASIVSLQANARDQRTLHRFKAPQEMGRRLRDPASVASASPFATPVPASSPSPGNAP
jgi:hypothetical protein